MTTTIDWAALARSIGSINESGEYGGSEYARQALIRVIGASQLRAAVDYYMTFAPGYELARSVLWHLTPEPAADYCYAIYQSDADPDRRHTAIQLLRYVAT